MEMTIFYIIVSLFVLIPLTIGIVVSIRYSRTDRKLNGVIKKYSFIREEELKTYLENWTNFDQNTQDKYGYNIVHEPYKATIDGNQLFIYKKVRFFTRITTEDLKEIAFPLKRRSASPLVIFFRPANVLQSARINIENREPSIFVDAGMDSLILTDDLREKGLDSAHSIGPTTLEDRINPEQLQKILKMRKHGAFSFVAYKDMAAVNFDPFNKDFNAEGLMSIILSLTSK